MPEEDGIAPRHGVVVLCAGASTRLGRPKQLLHHEGETLVRRAARLALTTLPHDAVIILGAMAEDIFPQVENLPIRRVDCADWQAGMNASLHAGVAALARECEGVLIVLCDQPALDSAHLIALCDAWRAEPDAAAASFYAGRLGVPALLPRDWFAQVPAHGDRGARDLLAARCDRVRTISNDTLAYDIDRADDLWRLAAG